MLASDHPFLVCHPKFVAFLIQTLSFVLTNFLLLVFPLRIYVDCTLVDARPVPHRLGRDFDYYGLFC